MPPFFIVIFIFPVAALSTVFALRADFAPNKSTGKPFPVSTAARYYAVRRPHCRDASDAQPPPGDLFCH